MSKKKRYNYCTHCGSALGSNDMYCSGCGVELDKIEGSQEAKEHSAYEDLATIHHPASVSDNDSPLSDHLPKQSVAEKVLIGLMTTLTVPILIMNILSGIVGFIWLAILGQWSLVIWGLVLLFIGTFIVSFLLIPGFIFLLPLTYFLERKSIVGLSIFGFLNMLYTATVITIVSFLIFSSFAGGPQNFLMPALLWAYAVATAPWSSMAKGENNIGTTITIFFTDLGLIFVVFMVGFFGYSLVQSFSVFVVMMFLPLIIGTGIVLSELNKSRKQYSLI